SDPDGCFSCHGLPDLEYIDKDGVRRVASILQSDYYSSLHGSVPCKDCHRQIERYPHKPEEGLVDCSESCHVQEPSKGKPFSHQDVVKEFKTSAHGSGHAPGSTKGFHGGNRLKEETDEQNPSCRRCHANTPYIKDSQMAAFKEAFQHVETECGVCHQGKTWRDQYSGHILRRLVGHNYSKADANTLCTDCHANPSLMGRVKLEDPITKDKKPASFRFAHAVDSYDKSLHGRLIKDGVEAGADCIDCHAPTGFRHGILRDEQYSASTHPGHLAETCGASGCHGYALKVANEGFLQTDMHNIAWLRLDMLPNWLDIQHLDSLYYRLDWMLLPLAALFAVGSLLWNFIRSGNTPVLGHDAFMREMIGVESAPGLLSRLRQRLNAKQSDPADANTQALTKSKVPGAVLLYASQTGNGEGLAEEMANWIEQVGFKAFRVISMADYDPAQIIYEQQVFIITSTHGDGEPPLPAHKLYAYLHGPDAPILAPLQYAVLGLGDSSYRQFCKAGKDFDAILEKLGAERIWARVDADADFEPTAFEWLDTIIPLYRKVSGDNGVSAKVSFRDRGVLAYGKNNPYPTGVDPQTLRVFAAQVLAYGKNNPYPARILTNQNLNGPGSSKDTRHIEIDLESSGLVYEAGDALGVIPRNNPRYVEYLLDVLRVDGYSEVALGQETLTVREAFYTRLDITALSRVLMEKYAELADSSALRELLADAEARFQEYAYGRHIVDMLADFPSSTYGVQEFVNILRRLPPRLYSISSSMKAVGNQVHLTVGTVRYHAHGRDREGVCSTFLSDRIGMRERLGIFVQANPHFRLPSAGNTDVIMVGPGTGIAPFRSFIQEREATGATGRNWLFFGDQRRDCDYLYADEWEQRKQNGVLSRLDLAFSRDQAEKIYVQTCMQQQGKALYDWLENGAHFYVCGDASRMANDVHQTLIHIVESVGSIPRERAEEYLQNMMHTGRYQRDVY
ncbi:MAG: sulfite reductase subunit alpha, partial [Methylococcaceae bacterium]